MMFIRSILLHGSLLVSLSITIPLKAAERVSFRRPFAPSDSAVAGVERPLRDELCLNGSWRFQPVATPADFVPGKSSQPQLPAPTSAGWDQIPIRIPSPWNANSFTTTDDGNPINNAGGDFRCFPSYPSAWNSVQMGWLARSFAVNPDWKGRRLLLRFDAVAGDCVVLVNGKPVATHFDEFLPFATDVTDAIRFDAPNQLLVGVRKNSLFNVPGKYGKRPYPEGSFWGQHIAGIWQDVMLIAVPAVHITDVYVKPSLATDNLDVEVTIRNDTAAPAAVSIDGDVSTWISQSGTDVVSAPEPKWSLAQRELSLPVLARQIDAGGSATVTLRTAVRGRLASWNPDHPNLHGLVVNLTTDGRQIDCKYTRFGWRELSFDGQKLLLNGQPINLKGDAWHFMGVPQMSRRYAWAWFRALKDANANAVRLHAEPYPSCYLDVADETGILVLDETAIWASDLQMKFDSPDFWPRCHDHIAALVRRDRNHPSVFGWSVSNEIVPVMRNCIHAPDQLWNRQIEAFNEWTGEVRELDPTRPWISGDGEDGGDGRLPVAVFHYGGPTEWNRIARMGKPWGIGECGMAYFGTPKDASAFVGDRAYQSMDGRMEGVAIEAYELLKGQRNLNPDYGCVFNLVWYGLQPLELGMTDTSRSPTIEDGIWFDPPVEGQPGMQPERLGPYCSTLNPGYDPRLPVYRPWPLFDAIKAANAPGKIGPCAWDHRVKTPEQQYSVPPVATVGVLCDVKKSPLRRRLLSLGATLVGDAVDAPQVLFVDGVALPSDIPAAKARVDAVLSAGGTVFAWHPKKESLDKLNAILPCPVELTDRQATSLLKTGSDPLVAGLTDGDLYFAEQSPGLILPAGIAGPVAERGRVLLKACDTYWRRWNNQPEMVKTAAVVRSERESKPPGAAMVVADIGKGRLVVCNVSVEDSSAQSTAVTRRLLENLGVKLEPVDTAGVTEALTRMGAIDQALVCGGFPAANLDKAADTDFLHGQSTISPHAGDKSGDQTWNPRRADKQGLFDFRKPPLTGPLDHSAVYLSFWVESPIDLTDLLAHPDLPHVDFIGGSDDGCQLFLNGRLLLDDRTVHPVNRDQLKVSDLTLRRGWNHFLIKVTQLDGEWQFAGRLQSSDADYLLSLRSALEGPR